MPAKKVAKRNVSDLDKSPGMSTKAEFAFKRYKCHKDTLMRMIKQNPDLLAELAKARYKKNSKILTPEIKSIIIYHLG